MHQFRPADVVVGRIAIGLQNPFPLAQKLARTITPPAQAEVEHGLTARFSVLPQIGLMILSAAVVHLNRHRSFVRL